MYVQFCYLKVSFATWGQDYKEKHKTRLKTNVKRTVLNNTKLRHFWAQIVSWAPIHARKTFIILAPGLAPGSKSLLPPKKKEFLGLSQQYATVCPSAASPRGDTQHCWSSSSWTPFLTSPPQQPSPSDGEEEETLFVYGIVQVQLSKIKHWRVCHMMLSAARIVADIQIKAPMAIFERFTFVCRCQDLFVRWPRWLLLAGRSLTPQTIKLPS